MPPKIGEKITRPMLKDAIANPCETLFPPSDRTNNHIYEGVNSGANDDVRTWFISIPGF